jgi:hypothetical protein
MQKIAAEKKVKNKTIIVKEYYVLDEIESCHILFVSKDSSVPFKRVVKKFDKKPP